MPFNNLPENRNVYFTGREEIIEKIHATFEKKESVALTQVIAGLGGIGKTQIALEYAYRYGYEYDRIWWINAETEDTILASFQNFALKMKIIHEDTKKAEVIIEAVRNWMQRNDNWLFIYDNAEQFNKEKENKESHKFEDYLPPQNRGRQHVLITSRNTRFERYTSIKLGVFTETETCEFIEKYTKKPADEHFKELAKNMGYLPLALDQAGAYMAINLISYKHYLDLYNKHNLELLMNDDYDKKTIATTWLISFQKINNPAAKQLLNLFAFFAPDNIFKQWFQKASEVLPESLQEVVSDELEYNNVIAELTKYSLVSLEEGTLNIHRLVQEVVRDSLKKEEARWRSICVDILNKLCYFDFSTAESRELFRILALHIVSVTFGIQDESATEKVAELYHFLGKGFYELADYSQALKYHEKALAIREKVLGKEHPDTATTNNEIAVVYYSKGDYDHALDFHNKALAIKEKVLSKEHPDTALAYSNIAQIYYAQGDYSKALDFLTEALTIKEKVLGKDHPSTATAYNNIALIYKNKGDYGKALDFYTKALAIREKVLGKEHPDTATTYNNIAAVYDDKGDYNRALEFYTKSLAIKEKVLGKEHPDTATTYNNIGLVYNNQGDYDRTLEFYTKALVILEKVLGKEHPDTATTYNNIGLVYNNQGDYDRALEFYNKDLAISEKVLGKEHPSTATTYNNIARVYNDKGDYDKALEWYLKALPILVKVLGEEHPNTQTLLNNMAYAYIASRKREPFESWLKKNLPELFGE